MTQPTDDLAAQMVREMLNRVHLSIRFSDADVAIMEECARRYIAMAVATRPMTADIKALVEKARNRIHDAPMETERLIDDLEAALAAQAEEIERLRGEPSEAQIEAAARAVHGMFYGYEGANPNSDPDDEDRAIARAALKAAQEVKA